MATPSPASASPSPVKKGLEGVVASETLLSDVDGARCQLIYRGYGLDELVGKASYEEVSFLLVYGHLPTRQEFDEWDGRLKSHRIIAPEIAQVMQQLPMGDPMDYLRTVVSIIGLADRSAEQTSREGLLQQAVRLIAQMPTIVAMFERLRRRAPLLTPRPDLGHAADFLYMLHGENPGKPQVAALDAYFVMLAEHGFNASTFAARTTVATQSDLYSGIVSAIGTLKGPLHGAANTKAMETLMEIGSPEQVEPFVQKTLADHKRFMGFGHRIYKGEDPRAKHLKRYAEELAEQGRDLKYFEIAERLKEAVWRVKQLNINVDFYSAPLLHSLGIPADLFTPMFACARIAGWAAHVMEQYADNRLIRPLAEYIGPRNLRFVPIDQRQSA